MLCKVISPPDTGDYIQNSTDLQAAVAVVYKNDNLGRMSALLCVLSIQKAFKEQEILNEPHLPQQSTAGC
jgi:hypothetical protein